MSKKIGSMNYETVQRPDGLHHAEIALLNENRQVMFTITTPPEREQYEAQRSGIELMRCLFDCTIEGI